MAAAETELDRACEEVVRKLRVSCRSLLAPPPDAIHHPKWAPAAEALFDSSIRNAFMRGVDYGLASAEKLR